MKAKFFERSPSPTFALKSPSTILTSWRAFLIHFLQASVELLFCLVVFFLCQGVRTNYIYVVKFSFDVNCFYPFTHRSESGDKVAKLLINHKSCTKFVHRRMAAIVDVASCIYRAAMSGPLHFLECGDVGYRQSFGEVSTQSFRIPFIRIKFFLCNGSTTQRHKPCWGKSFFDHIFIASRLLQDRRLLAAALPWWTDAATLLSS